MQFSFLMNRRLKHGVILFCALAPVGVAAAGCGSNAQSVSTATPVPTPKLSAAEIDAQIQKAENDRNLPADVKQKTLEGLRAARAKAGS